MKTQCVAIQMKATEQYFHVIFYAVHGCSNFYAVHGCSNFYAVKDELKSLWVMGNPSC